jgi:hypothetical protein
MSIPVPIFNEDMSRQTNFIFVQYELMRYTLKGDYLKEKSRLLDSSDPQTDLVNLWYNRLVEFNKRSRRRL